MKIKEFIREVGYSMNYMSEIKITIGSYDVTFRYDDENNIINVFLEDFDGENYIIAILREECSLIPDYYHKWCDNILCNGSVNIAFRNDNIIDILVKHDLEFSVYLNKTGEKCVSIILSNKEYRAPIKCTKYWDLVWDLIKSQTGIID